MKSAVSTFGLFCHFTRLIKFNSGRSTNHMGLLPEQEVHMEVIKGDYSLMGTQGKYTIADIEALPERQRAELFDGEMIMMASPTTTHQRLLRILGMKICNYIDGKKGNCEMFWAPFAVYIKKGIWNYFEPDIVVICDTDKLDKKGCHGASDLVIAVGIYPDLQIDTTALAEMKGYE